MSYAANNQLNWPADETDMLQYIDKAPVGEYDFNVSNGRITSAIGWGGFNFDVAGQILEQFRYRLYPYGISIRAITMRKLGRMITKISQENHFI